MDHHFKLLVNGQLVDGASRFDVVNPATGEAIKIPAKTAVKITVSKACKDAVLGAAK